MRSNLEILVRGWGRPVPLVCVGVLLGAAVAPPVVALSPFLASTPYVFALLAAALVTYVSSGLERASWSRPVAHQDGLLLLSVMVVSATISVLAQLRHSEHAPTTAALFGCAHLAALALVFRRVPLHPASRTLVFLASATALPALVPGLRPLLDASPSFRAEHFPRWGEALAPILSLIVIAIALPSNTRPGFVGERSA